MKSDVISMLLLVACCASAQTPATVKQDSDLLWESTERAPKGIQVEITGMYDTLYELKKAGVKIQTRKATLADEYGATVLGLMQSEKLYVGSGEAYPRGLDLLVCELNDDKCTVRSDEKGIPKAKWAKVTNAEILIPDLKLESTTQVQTYEKKRGDRISNIVVNERAGCESYDKECDEKVRALNPNSKKLERQYQGTILVPATGYSTKVPLPATVSKDIAEGAITSRYGVSRSSADRFLGNVIAPPKSLLPNVQAQPVSRAAKNEATLSELLDVIKYRQLDGNDRKLRIGIVDSMPDFLHCLFDLQHQVDRKQVWEYSSISKNPFSWNARKGANGCGKVSALPVSEDEHGTYLLGLWFSRKNGQYGAGMLPFGDDTYLGFGAFKYGQLTQPKVYIELGRILSAMSLDAIRVVNLSWGTPAVTPSGDVSLPKNEGVAAAIGRLGAAGDSPTLFVVSAGNQRTELTEASCGITPACPSGRKNVLTVTSLTNDARDPEITGNFGKPVDIAAPATDLVSTLRNDLLGKSSGSSQAAAIVSAAAGMLIYSTGIPPERVRYRLIYTSDLTPKLQEGNGQIFGGRINFARAAELRRSQISVKGEPETTASVGFYGKEPTLNVIPADTASPVSIRFSDIKRLVRRRAGDEKRSHTIFYIRNGDLLRVDGVVNSTSGNIKIVVTPSGKGPKDVYVKEIADYTAPVAGWQD